MVQCGWANLAPKILHHSTQGEMEMVQRKRLHPGEARGSLWAPAGQRCGERLAEMVICVPGGRYVEQINPWILTEISRGGAYDRRRNF